MIDLRSVWSDFWSNLASVTNTITIIDFIDVAVVAFIIYKLVGLVRETRAMQLVKGIAAIFAVYFVSNMIGMITLSYLIQNVLQVGLFAIVVLFQPELRRALEQMGRTKISFMDKLTGADNEEQIRQRKRQIVDVVCESSEYLSKRKIGALMVIEREIRLGDIIKTGTVINSDPSVELICNIFFPNSPLHDGAMILRGGKLHAAGCFLPLSGNTEIGRELGTRHRAALGMSEESDAVVVVVSEETGAISVAMDSRLQRGLSAQNLRKLLEAKLGLKVVHEEPPQKSGLGKVKR